MKIQLPTPVKAKQRQVDSDIWRQTVKNMRNVAADYDLTKEQLDTICLTVAGEVASNVSTAGAHLVTTTLIAKGKDATYQWIKELTK